MIEIEYPVIDKFAAFNSSEDTQYAVNYGGAGSGKSHDTAREFAFKLLYGTDLRMLVTRKVYAALKITAQQMILEALAAWRFPVARYFNKTEGMLQYRGNQILFRGMDNPEKIKSAEFNYIWMEETTDFTKADFMQLKLRLRRKNRSGRNRMFMTFNPIDQYHWCITDLVDKAGTDPEIAVLHSTHEDNPYLTEDYRKELRKLQEQDENYYRIYCLGEPGVLRNIIYTNYVIDPMVPAKFDDIFYGLDFGFNNETALVCVGIRDRTVYVEEKLYRTGLTNADLIRALQQVGIGTAPIYCDAAEPARIQEIVNAGFCAYPANKEVKDGIDVVKRHRLHITPESTHLTGEIRGYKYREDKDGNVLDEPVKFRDHLMDALRYAIHTHIGQEAGADRFTIRTGNRRW